MGNYYTYAYLREDNTPYYIGMGSGIRIDKQHLRGCTDIRPPEDRRIKLKQNLTREEAFKHEVYMISVLGRKDLGTGILRNMTDGGDGARGVVDTSVYTSMGMLGKKMPEKAKKALHKHKSRWLSFSHKDGRCLTLYTTLKRFCEEHNLDRRTMIRVMKGERGHKSHKGWTVRDLTNP